ncbi:cytochrome P450 [Ophiobolus disseminans]|uniref:Cytochrome P450 n=1 Tax=Ophiobolus disseminans TaxID=1469910 RepID=A0A6A7A6S6_9PLEO|nr:cytochrome P450 [Ophiobolus disseminans]
MHHTVFFNSVHAHGCKEPPKLPLDLNVVNKQAALEHTFLETTTRLFAEHGKTYKATRSGRTIIRTCDPEVSKAVLSTQFEHFGLQPIRYEEGKGFFGNGILVTDGPQWKHSRTLIRPTFDIAHVANFGRLEGHVMRFMNLLPRDGSTVDLFPLLKRLTLDISSEFIFGRSMDALSSQGACKGFMDAFMAAQRDVIIPVPKRTKEYGKWCKEVLDYIDDRVTEAMDRVTKPSESDSGSKQVRIIDELLATTHDRRTLKYLALSIFSPAHDSVAITIGNAMFHLARNTESWARLRAEIMPTTCQPLTYEMLNSFKYLNWVLRESSVRECLSTTVLPRGGGNDGQSPLLVEKGDLVEINFRSSHRDQTFWGEDADLFRPERWETIRPTWEYIPFSGGPRICPAFRMVYTECGYIMVSMIRAFAKIENRDKVEEWVEERRLTFQSLNGTKIGLLL